MMQAKKAGIMIIAGCIVLAATACHSRQDESTPRQKHLAAFAQRGSSLYVDKVDNRMVMSKESDTATGRKFISYKVAFYDSTLVSDDKKKEALGLYYQYKMPDDWKALVGKDSIAPVFYQPVTTLNSQANEGILVFELPDNIQPDALVYHDASGLWNTQIIVLKSK